VGRQSRFRPQSHQVRKGFMRVNLNNLLSKITPLFVASRDINIGRDLIGNQTNITTRKHTLKTFEKLLEDADNWVREWIDYKEIWAYKHDAIYQIEIDDAYHKFTESWTRVYPDEFDSDRHSVNLKINNTIIKQIPFISCDGGRINVPMPERRVVDKKF
jgi:hypothetical protein